MKKILLAFILSFIFFFSSRSQFLFGVTPEGGGKGGGALTKFIPATNDFSVQLSFQKPGANTYYSSLTLAKDGKFYGTTFNGGANDAGIIFSFDPATSTYLILYDFDNVNGAQPSGSLIQAKDGKLYGMSSFGGALNAGVIFSFDPVTSVYSKLFDFDNDNGANPSGSLLQTADGKMYGMTAQGGVEGVGVIFSFDPSSLIVTKLDDLDLVNGAVPTGSLVPGGDGLLYGMCANGGADQAGVIFAFNPNKLTYAKLKNFDSMSGYYPGGSLVKAIDGKFYGMTFKGGNDNDGVLFSFDYASGTYVKLHDFNGTDGADPLGNIVQGKDEKIYGMTSDGGNSNAGVIFSYDPHSSKFNKLKDFDYTNGKSPFSTLVLTNDGKFYSTTFEGGVNNGGVIFSFDPATGNYVKLRDVGTSINGQQPCGSLLRAVDGKFYGMTTFGGMFNLGVIYSFDPNFSGYKKLMDFDSTNGANPYGSFIQLATDGKLYAMTNKGGNNDAGVIFSFDPATATYTKLYDFDEINGDNPYGSLLPADNGKLYGLTSNGGKYGFGSMFSFNPSNARYIREKDFDHTNGGNPYGSLVQSDDGKLYGMTTFGGKGYTIGEDTTGAGVIFSFDPSKSSFKKLHDFDYYNDGGFCYGSFIKATNGRLYAITKGGGINENGVIFSFNPQTSTLTKLYDFDGSNGSNPYGNLFQDGNGNFYGMTYGGGTNNIGVVFSFDPSSLLYTTLINYDNANGARPYIGSAFIEVPEGGPLPVTIINFSGKNNGNVNQLSWQVGNEQNSAHYELQRSNDGNNFTGIFQIATTGNTDYNYSDNIAATLSPVYYYRLKIVDKDGDYRYSEIIKLSRNFQGNLVKVNPNPFKEKIVVTVESLTPDKVTFILTDTRGRQLLRATRELSEGTNVITINEINNLPKGAYLLTVVQSQHSQTIRVIKGD